MSGTVILASAVLSACAAEGPAQPAVAIGYIGSPDSAYADAWRGAQLGADEVMHAAGLIGRSVAVHAEQARDSSEVRAAAIRLLDLGATVVIGGHDEASCRALMRVADSANVVFLNTGCSSDALRGTSPNTFHVQPSETQRRAPDGGPAATRPETRVVWHGELGRYGAAQLNRRFLERFGTPAGGDAWAAWMAMKIAWEATQRQGSSPAALAAYLKDGGAEFDGHKGQPLTFDARGQLRQPLFAAPAGPTGSRRATDARAIAVDGADELRSAVAAGAPLAVVTNEGSSDVSVIDTRAQSVIARISLAARPRGVRVSARHGVRAYVAMSDDAPEDESDADAIAVLDLARAEVVGLHRAGSDPEQFALSPDGRQLYAANEDAGTATMTDLAGDSVLATLIVGIEPEGVAASPDGHWVYVTAETSNTVSVIDTRSREVVASFLVDVRPRAAAFAPDGRQAYVTNEISGTLSIVAVPAHEVVGAIELAGGAAKPVGIAVAPDGSRVYVANGHANSISVVDPHSRQELAVVPVGRRPWGIDISSDGTRIYTANGGSNDVSVIDTRTLRVVATIPVGERPWGVALTR